MHMLLLQGSLKKLYHYKSKVLSEKSFIIDNLGALSISVFLHRRTNTLNTHGNRVTLFIGKLIPHLQYLSAYFRNKRASLIVLYCNRWPTTYLVLSLDHTTLNT